MESFTLEEQTVCYIARSFKPHDDYAVIATSYSGLVALALAKELYAPRLSLLGSAKGKYAIVKNPPFPNNSEKFPEECIETLLNVEDVFSMCVGGKYFIIMQPVQVDQYGYMNLSLLGDMHKPSSVFVGSRNVPSNTVNMPRTLYFVPRHLRRIFVEKVDFKSGVGYGRERREGIVKWGTPIEIISNLCVIDFEEETGRARLKSIHTGIALDQVKENTGFELIVPERLSETRAPTDEELHLLRNVIDPLGVRRLDFVKGEEYKQVMGEIMSGWKH